MEIEYKQNTYINIKNKFNTIENKTIFICAKSGFGKGLLAENILQTYWESGYLIISLADPKAECEMAFCVFEPEEQYHLEQLRLVGRKPKKIPCKFYHPFSFGIPRGVKLPPIEFYTFSLKELDRKEWSLLAETGLDSDTIKLLLNARAAIGNNDGINSFMHYLQDIIRGKSKKKNLEPDPKNFYLSATSGTSKSLQDISNYLQGFKHDYFLAKDSSPLNLDWKKILSDRSKYHVFLSNWLKDDKMKAFCILTLFNKILENKDYCKFPVMIFIPEIKDLTPDKPDGFEQFLARGIKKNLTIMRSKGRGFSCVYDTQVFTDVDERVRNSPTVTFFGELGGDSDKEKVSKARNYKRSTRELLDNMETKNTYLWSGHEDEGAWRHFFPSHMHCEASYNFFEMYRKHYPNNVRNYNELLDKMKKEFDTEENKFKDRVKKRMKEEKKQKEQEVEEKAQKSTIVKKAEQQIKKAREIKDVSKKELIRLVYEFKEKNPELSWRKIGEEFNTNHHKVKRYYESHKEQIETRPDHEIEEEEPNEQSEDDLEVELTPEDMKDDLNKMREK